MQLGTVTRRFSFSASDIVRLSWLMLCTALALFQEVQAQPALPSTNATSPTEVTLQPAAQSIWEHGVGEGFSPGAQSFTLGAGATYGFAAFGSVEAHDLALASFTYGHMLGRTKGLDHWYRGNFEFRLELFTGAQFSPSTEWFVGLTPHIRYNFATGTRWIPFMDAGAGVTATGIGPPDLSGTFEFNLQGGPGVHWFLEDDLALTLEVRYVHWSCAGIHHPNLGLNGITGMLGVTFFF
jgi:lipid A 3-O-deacylase